MPGGGPAACRARARRRARRPGRRASGGASCAARERSGRPPAGRSSSRRCDGARDAAARWPARLARPARRRAVADACARSAQRYLSDPRLRTLLDRYATYTGSDPRRAPAALAVDPVRRADLRRLVRRAAACAGSATRCASARWRCGVRVRTGADVAEVLGHGAAGPTGVRLRRRRRRVDADVVVSNADAAHLYADLRRRPARPRAGRRRLRRRDPVAVRLRRAARPARPHARPAAPHRAVPRRTTTRSSTRLRRRAPRPVAGPDGLRRRVPDDPAVRPDADHEAWFVLVNAPRHGQRGRTGPSTGTPPGLADVVRRPRPRRAWPSAGSTSATACCWQQVRTPADLERRTRAVGGAIYGTVVQRRPRGVPAPGQPLAGARPLPRRRLVAPRRRPPARRAVRRIVADLIGPA